MIHNFPYTDFHEINLDWLMKQICKLSKDMEDFELVNKLVYMGEWDNTKNYDQFSIVVYNNKGYLAIQPVPAGIPLSNTAYWQEIAEFTPQIADIATQVNNVEDGLNAIVPLAVSSKTKIMANTKCLLVGNSYAYGSGGSGYSGWVYQFESMTGVDADIIQQRGGDFCQPAANNSPMPTYPNKTYRQAITSFVGTKTVEELAEYRWVIFGGGYNDGAFGHSYDDIVTEITNTVGYIRSNFPNAEIAIIPLSSTTHNFAGGGAAFEEYQTFTTAWADAAIKNGCYTTTHSLNWFYGKSEYQGSGYSNIHLNDAGYKKCAEYILAIINGWDGCLHEDLTGEVTFNQYVSTTDGYIRCIKQDDAVYLRGHVTLNDNSDTGSFATHDLLTVPASCSTDRWASFQAAYLYKSGMYAPIMLSLNSAGLLSIRNNAGILSQFNYSEDYQIIFDLVIPYGN